eukprot:scaffold121408_cov30-Tisochrysis_lutea.AAC.9
MNGAFQHAPPCNLVPRINNASTSQAVVSSSSCHGRRSMYRGSFRDSSPRGKGDTKPTLPSCRFAFNTAFRKPQPLNAATERHPSTNAFLALPKANRCPCCDSPSNQSKACRQLRTDSSSCCRHKFCRRMLRQTHSHVCHVPPPSTYGGRQPQACRSQARPTKANDRLEPLIHLDAGNRLRGDSTNPPQPTHAPGAVVPMSPCHAGHVALSCYSRHGVESLIMLLCHCAQVDAAKRTRQGIMSGGEPTGG